MAGDSFNVTYDITDSGNPNVTPTWTFNGTVLVDNSRVTIMDNGLQFSTIENGDIGTYVATFSNAAGDTTFTVTLKDAGFPVQGTIQMTMLLIANIHTNAHLSLIHI